MRIMGRTMGGTILMKIIMGTNTQPRIITTPITPILMATITILTLKDMGVGNNTTASNLGRLANMAEAEGAVAVGAGTEVGGRPSLRYPHWH
jgi:hypothetical protein